MLLPSMARHYQCNVNPSPPAVTHQDPETPTHLHPSPDNRNPSQVEPSHARLLAQPPCHVSKGRVHGIAKRPRTITPSPDNRDPSQVEPSHARLLAPTAQPSPRGQGARVHETPTHHHPQPRQSRRILGRAEPRSAALPNRPAISTRAGCTGSRNAHAPSPPSPDNRDPSQVEPSHARLLSPTAQPCVQGQGAPGRETPTHHHPQPRQSRRIPGRAEPRSAALPPRPTHGPHGHTTKVPAPPRRAFLPARRSRARSTRPSSVAPAGRGGAAGRTRYRVPGTATTSPAASAAQTAAPRS